MKKYIIYLLLLFPVIGFSQDNLLPPGDCVYLYLDHDHDGYGTGPRLCSPEDDPESGDVYVPLNGDCNDNDPNVTIAKFWYYDGDGDGFGGTSTANKECIAPTGYVAIGGDCNDTNNLIHPNTIWYVDNDNDSFGSSTATPFVGCYPTPQIGYVLNNLDCNDNNALIEPGTKWYYDGDGDGFGNNNVAYIVQCNQPANYVLDNTDCDDNNTALTTIKTWYVDADGDGFGESTSTVSCSQPSGYVANNLDECPGVSGSILGCVVPSSNSSFSGENYILTITPKIPITNNVQQITDEKDVVKNITYFDGLGRPIQQIVNGQSNTGKDIVTPVEYDNLGRQAKDYLSYPSSQKTMAYIDSVTAQADAIAYYQTLYGDSNPYNEKEFEASPLNRILKQAAPGNDWALGSGHEIKMDYMVNNANEVKYFEVTTTLNTGNLSYDIPIVDNGYYAGGKLYKTVVKDENWTSGDNNTTQEFKTKEGQVVLKRVFNDGAYDTYYVYDKYGNLTYVLPPLAEANITQVVLDGLCYQYKYDIRNRLVAKKLPGKQWEFIVYDKQDRPVATGPAFSPWGDGSVGMMITEYDVFGRVTQTGWKAFSVSESNRSVWQGNVNGGSNPFVLGTNDILTKNYYDNYSFPNAPVPPSAVEGQNIATNVKGLATGSWVRVLTSSSALDAEESYTLYDTKYRPVRSCTKNYLTGYIKIDSKLNFIGKPEYTITRHKRLNGDTEIVVKDMFTYSAQDRLVLNKQQINSLPEQLIAKNEYDELGQLISKNVGGTDATGAVGLQKADYSYNIRGWLKSINDVNNMTGANADDLFALKINYQDNDNTSHGVYGVNKLYNGNISETFWKTKNDGVLRKYGYTYDNLNRLTDAVYQKPQSSVAVTNSYNESLQYDKNGNITHLTRTGEYDDSVYQLTIDDLTYSYGNTQNPNRLTKVFDSTNNPKGFIDDTAGTDDPDDDYSYDDNGNMISDTNKGISGITYNHLNLPTKIIFGYGEINYIYNALGQKIQKNAPENMGGIIGFQTKTTDYLEGGFQYKDGLLLFFPHAEGYVNVLGSVGNANNNYNYAFNYTDHLGNVRLTYGVDPSTNTLKIMEENNYYPFGLKHKNYNISQKTYTKTGLGNVSISESNSEWKYKFGGKELQDELGLNVYDYGARNYDPAIGRWMNIDPLAEKYFHASTYAYVGNDPINFTDPDGMDRYYMNGEGKTVLALKEDKEDILFIGDKKNENIVDVNKDGKQDDKDGLTVKSKGLLGQLVNPRYENSYGSAYTSIGEMSKQHEEDYLNIFKFTSDNVQNVEFSLNYFTNNDKEYLEFGTYQNRDVSPVPHVNQSKIHKSYHSHSDTVNDVTTERHSMGDRGDNWPFGYPPNDFNNSMYFKTPYTKYVYFPISKRLYSVTKESIDYVKKISKSSDFKMKK